MLRAKPVDTSVIESRKQILLAVLKEAREHSRQHEAQRSVATNMVLLLAAANIGAIATLKLENRTLPLAAALIVIGAFGFLLSAKHYERAEWSTAVAREIEERLDSLDDDLKIQQLKIAATGRHERRFARMHKVRLNKIWSYLHVIVSITGMVLVAIILLTR